MRLSRPTPTAASVRWLNKPRACTVPFLQPFTGAVDLQSGAVDQQMDGPRGGRQPFETDASFIARRLTVL